MSSSNEDTEIKATILGRDLGSIPCFRSSFLNGIGGGIGTGLAFFLFTSKVRRSCNTAVLSFAGITLSYWVYCRYRWSQKKFNMTMLQTAMKEHGREGTENDLQVPRKPEEKS
ncbi:cytochrome c oxidase assembly protein COX20, mitochondrial-like [Daphnia carinata]|uniref:cytochrome c oxidase assembly protein COX20, mitochondrial-like n=1 Tax=Daphnia carinata TaxID=120202 RepID=UPI0025799B05|nr:cytochrome c oxidase assembly protein COX20, mitochondrial-like [Daphnia carinata]XP_059350475.1 cytochrome c oxidase assembly protein COX20, mitochondrial-like [Daphnia carinata]